MSCPAGSAPPCETTEPNNSEADRTQPEGTELSGETRTYVVSAITIPKPAGNALPGFNLDGIDSGDNPPGDGDCQQRAVDYVSTIDPGLTGVDNVLGGQLVATIEGLIGSDADMCPGGADGCLDALVQDQIEGGSLLLLMTVSDLDSLSYDASVQLNLSLGMLPAGATLMVDGSGQITPGQVFEIATDIQTVPGDIFNGRLRAQVAQLAIPIPVGDDVINLVIDNPEVRFNISETGLGNGAIGGVLEVDVIVQAALDIAGFDAQAIIEGFADVGVGATPEDPCTQLSVGLQFSAVPAG